MLLQVRSLAKSFTRNGQSFKAVDQVNFQLQAGEMAVLSGPSGCGKSTFFNLLTGILPADQGQIFFQGQDISQQSEATWTKLRAHKLAYVPQTDSLLDNLCVLDNIILPHSLSGHPALPAEDIAQLLRGFGLAAVETAFPPDLSGGERRRVAMVRALAQDPLLLIADEPTGDLDPDNAQIILTFLQKKAQEGLAVLLSTHQLESMPAGLSHYHMQAGQIDLS